MGRITRIAVAAAICGVSVTAAAQGANADKVLLCHGTASDSNPYVLISVSANALAGHLDGTAPGHGKNNYPDYVLPAGSTDCSDGPDADNGGGGE